ncbi:unnamed protein product [Clonostachys rhizophaga]|uniref:Major facilitator superfamily (MFS) profile domain-containing protein n=1 Tax=Clonostachys rhizophaga TaxID=160324 RepID=A0A9N9V6R2_9HYPO|nr:unnamed protein product [Clonostachys rhizophaga]
MAAPTTLERVSSVGKEPTVASHSEKLGTGPGQTVEEFDNFIQQEAAKCPAFYKCPNLLKLYLLMASGCLLPAVTLGFDSSMMNGLQAVPAWDTYFNSPRGSILGITTAILGLGAITTTPFLSPIGDRFGRRWAIFLGTIIMIIGGVLQGASVHIGMFIASRFIIGLGLVFANTFAPVLIGELAHPKHRHVATSLYQTSYYLGAILAAWTTFGTFRIESNWSWRIPSYLQAAPALVQACCIWFVPESPRFLIAKSRPEEARAILVKYHAEGDEDSEFVNAEFRQMRAVIEAEVANKTTWKTMIATPGNRRRVMVLVMLGIFSQWSGNGLVSYYIARILETVGITDASDKNIINGCLNIWNWITAVASAIISGRLKRRTHFIVSTVGMFVVFSIQTLCAGLFNERGNKTAGHVVIAMLFLFYPFFNFAFNALLYSYPVEILPYPIRAKGFSVLMIFNKGGVFLNVFVNPIGLQNLGWKYYGVYVGWLLVEIFCVWKFFPETSGHSLEAIAAAIDGKTVVDNERAIDERIPEAMKERKE